MTRVFFTNCRELFVKETAEDISRWIGESAVAPLALTPDTRHEAECIYVMPAQIVWFA